MRHRYVSRDLAARTVSIHLVEVPAWAFWVREVAEAFDVVSGHRLCRVWDRAARVAEARQRELLRLVVTAEGAKAFGYTGLFAEDEDA